MSKPVYPSPLSLSVTSGAKWVTKDTVRVPEDGLVKYEMYSSIYQNMAAAVVVSSPHDQPLHTVAHVPDYADALTILEALNEREALLQKLADKDKRIGELVGALGSAFEVITYAAETTDDGDTAKALFVEQAKIDAALKDNREAL